MSGKKNSCLFILIIVVVASLPSGRKGSLVRSHNVQDSLLVLNVGFPKAGGLCPVGINNCTDFV